MRIEDKVNVGYDKRIEQAPQKDNKREKVKSQVTSQNDKISLSDAAKDLAALKSVVKNSSDIRTEKIDKIRNDIKSGNYNVTGKQVAEKIVKTAIDDLF